MWKIFKNIVTSVMNQVAKEQDILWLMH